MPGKPVKQDRDPALIFLMMVIILVPVLGPVPQMQGFPWIIRLSVLLPLLPLLLAFIAYRKSALLFSLHPVMLSVWGIVLLAAISSLWAVSAWGAVAGSIKWFYVALMSVAVYSVARDGNSLHKIMLACAVAGGYMAFIGVSQYLYGHQVYVTPVGQYPWPSASSGHKNMASQFVVMTLPFALYLSLTARRSLVYWLANPLIALMLAYIVYGRARQALVALIAQVLIIAVAASLKKSRQLIKPNSLNKGYFQSLLASLILFVALVLAPPFDKPFSWQKTAVSEFASRTEVFTKEDATLEQMSNGRYATWKKTTSMIGDHPAGVGLGNWKVLYPRYNVDAGDDYRPPGNDVWGDAHNDYLQILAELGLGSILAAGLLLWGLWKAYRTIWTNGSASHQRSSLFIGLGLTGLFSVMMFSYPLALTAPPIFLGIYLALLAAISSFSLPQEASKQLAFGPAIVMVLAVLAITGAYFGKRELSAWNHGFLAKALGERVFQQGGNNPYATQRFKLILAENVDESYKREPWAPDLNRDNIISYTNLSLFIDHERLAETYRQKALDAALSHLKSSPHDSHIHVVVATRLGVSADMAIEHIGKAIELDPANLVLFEYMKSITVPAREYEKAMTIYEFYISRFFNQKVNEDYAYFAKQAKMEDRAVDRLTDIDLSRHLKKGSDEYDKAEKSLSELIQRLKSGS